MDVDRYEPKPLNPFLGSKLSTAQYIYLFRDPFLTTSHHAKFVSRYVVELCFG